MPFPCRVSGSKRLEYGVYWKIYITVRSPTLFMPPWHLEEEEEVLGNAKGLG